MRKWKNNRYITCPLWIQPLDDSSAWKGTCRKDGGDCHIPDTYGKWRKCKRKQIESNRKIRGIMKNRYDEMTKKQVILLKNIKDDKEHLRKMLDVANGHWASEDFIYRYYHHSFKVFYIQSLTDEMYRSIKHINPGKKLSKQFKDIMSEGTEKKFKDSTNDNWDKETRPLIEAFFHAKYFIEMFLKYGTKFKEPVDMLPSGWAAVLCLYQIR